MLSIKSSKQQSSDYGPCTTKFLETHFIGLGKEEMGQITNKVVERFQELVGNVKVANKG